MKAIVTGGAGFIGSHICEELMIKGHEVISIDDYSAGRKSNVPAGVLQLNVDVTDRHRLAEVFGQYRPDVVFHNAASKKTVCLKSPLRDLEVNVMGTFNVANQCYQNKVKMIHASTGSVYGERRDVMDEGHPVNPVSYYGVSKLAGEKYVQMFGSMGMKYCILRYFHVYGSRQDDRDDVGGVVAIWLRRIKEGKPIKVFGDGSQVRSFTYVKDVAKANILAIDQTGVYNCASGGVYSLSALILALMTRFGHVPVEFEDWQVGDIREFDVDNSAIRYWMPKWIDLNKGLRHMQHGKY